MHTALVVEDPAAAHTTYELNRDPAQTALDAHIASQQDHNLRYVGEWHSHPALQPPPRPVSRRDQGVDGLAATKAKTLSTDTLHRKIRRGDAVPGRGGQADRCDSRPCSAGRNGNGRRGIGERDALTLEPYGPRGQWLPSRPRDKPRVASRLEARVIICV